MSSLFSAFFSWSFIRFSLVCIRKKSELSEVLTLDNKKVRLKESSTYYWPFHSLQVIFPPEKIFALLKSHKEKVWNNFWLHLSGRHKYKTLGKLQKNYCRNLLWVTLTSYFGFHNWCLYVIFNPRWKLSSE